MFIEVKIRNDGEDLWTLLNSVRVYPVAEISHFDNKNASLESGRKSVRPFSTWRWREWLVSWVTVKTCVTKYGAFGME